MGRSIFTGNIDRRTKDTNNFIYFIFLTLMGSIFAAFILTFLFGGGSMEDFSHFHIVEMFRFIFTNPEFDFHMGQTGIYVAALLFLILFCYGYMDYERKKNSRVGEEYGSSKLLTAKDLPQFRRYFFYNPEIVKKHYKKTKTVYDLKQLKRVCKRIPGHWMFSNQKKRKKMERDLFLNCQILGKDVYLSTNVKFLNRNLHTLTIGGSGQGKSYSELFPNALMGKSNYVFTDPSGEILSKIGRFLEEQCGYKILVFNLDEMQKSMKYNFLRYIKTDADYNLVVDALNRNIKPRKECGGNVNEFFDDAKDALMCALIALLKELYPDDPGKQTFKNIMRLLEMAEQETTEKGGTRSKLDDIFEKLREHDPRSYAAAQYKAFKVGGPKVCNEVIISASSVFSRYFNTDDLEWLTCRDELHLEQLGTDQPVALFIVTPAANTTYNFLASMIYSQLFTILTKMGRNYADEQHLSDPMLPRHISLWLDEFANIGKIPNFLELLSVVRKYNISVNIIIQTMSQLKGMYKDSWETLVGNCDSMIYLGGQEGSTIKMLSEKLGKETIKTHSYNIGKSGGETYQNQGRNLLTPDEIEQMDRANELVFITGCKPIMTSKYDLSKHPNFKYSGEADPKNNYDVSMLSVGNEIDYEYLDECAISEEEINGFDFTRLKVKHGHQQGAVVSNKWRVFNRQDRIELCKYFNIPIESQNKSASYYGLLLDEYDRQNGTEDDPVPVKNKKTNMFMPPLRRDGSEEEPANTQNKEPVPKSEVAALSEEQRNDIKRRKEEYEARFNLNVPTEEMVEGEIFNVDSADNLDGYVAEYEFIPATDISPDDVRLD